MTQSHSGEAELARARMRATVDAVAATCWALYPLLPVEQPWRGPASLAFRLRVAGLRERVDRALAALEDARAQL